MQIDLDLDRLKGCFGPAEGVHFLALLSPETAGCFRLARGRGYASASVVPTAAGEIPALVAAIEDRAHVFCVTTDAPFRSPTWDRVAEVKLGVLPLFSTGFSWRKLREALRLIYAIDYEAQYRASQTLLDALAGAARIVFASEAHGTRAVLELDDPAREIFFFNQSGPLHWGRQSVLPGGEVSLLTNLHGQFSGTAKFALNGELPLVGFPVLHRGQCPCRISRAGHPCPDAAEQAGCATGEPRYVPDWRQEQVFRSLLGMEKSGAIAVVEQGVIREIRQAGPDDSFPRALRRFCEQDAHYWKIHELGFGLNASRRFFLRENFLPNEMRAGVHIGLGLTPYTDFHLDLVCPSIAIFAEAAGRPRRLPLG